MRNIQTLHAHTTNSDGELNYLQVLKVCEKNNIGAVAFTDHDTLISEKDFEDLKNYTGPVKFISGVEISSGLPLDLGGGNSSELHIVGLFVDPTNDALKKHCILAQQSRISRMEQMVKNLTGLGFDITNEDCLEASGGETVARPHIVTALKSKATNLYILEQLRLKMAEESNSNLAVKAKYDAMMERGETQYPYVLFLSDGSYIPNIYVESPYFIDMDSCVKLIRDAGGVAILAHYFTIAKKLNKELLEQMLIDNRLDGAETVYGLFGLIDTSSEIAKIITETSNMTTDLIEKHKKLASGGADAHTEEVFIAFANSGDYAKKTIGFAENIIANSNVDIKWSNFTKASETI